jgi:hypothetical protein
MALIVCENKANQAATYLNEMITRRSLRSSPQDIISETDLGWKMVNFIVFTFTFSLNLNVCKVNRPSFDQHVVGPGIRTVCLFSLAPVLLLTIRCPFQGTYPYMSHEIIGRHPPPHDAIHDLESLWWIIVHLALIREGPGKRRTVASGSNLEVILADFFDGDQRDLTLSKEGVFARKFNNSKDNMKLELFDYFHDYFDPIKPVLEKWWIILKSGFEFRGYEYANIHEMILNVLEQEVETFPESDGDLTEKELTRRAAYHRETLKAIRTQTSVPFHLASPDSKEKMNPPAVSAQVSNPTSPSPVSKRPKV